MWLIFLISCLLLSIPALLFLWQKFRVRKQRTFMKKLQTLKRQRRQQSMNEMLQRYVGKKCIIYTLDAQITGIVQSIESNWVEIQTPVNINLLNTDYIVRIRDAENAKKKAPAISIAN